MNHVVYNNRAYYFYDTIKHIKNDGEVIGLFYNEPYVSDCIYVNGYYIYSKVNNKHDDNKREIYVKNGSSGAAVLKASFNGNDDGGGGLFFYCGDKIVYTGAQIWKYSTDNGNTWKDCSISGGSFGEILDIYYSVKDKKGLAVGNNGFYKTNDGINYTFNSYTFSNIACQNNIISYGGNDKWYLFTGAGSGASPTRFSFAWYQISGTSVKKGRVFVTRGTYIGNQNLGIVKLDGNNVCLFFGVGEAYKSSTDNSIVDRYYKPFMPFIFYLYDYDESKILLSTKGIQGYYNIEDI